MIKGDTCDCVFVCVYVCVCVCVSVTRPVCLFDPDWSLVVKITDAVKGAAIIGRKNKSAFDRDTSHQDEFFHTCVNIQPMAQ